MKIKDLRIAKKELLINTGLQIIYTPFYEYYVLINTDNRMNSSRYYGDYFPGISNNKIMQNVIIDNPWSDRKMNIYRVNLVDFLFFDKDKLSVFDRNKLIKVKTDILIYLETNKRHYNYFYNKTNLKI